METKLFIPSEVLSIVARYSEQRLTFLEVKVKKELLGVVDASGLEQVNNGLYNLDAIAYETVIKRLSSNIALQYVSGLEPVRKVHSDLDKCKLALASLWGLDRLVHTIPTEIKSSG